MGRTTFTGHVYVTWLRQQAYQESLVLRCWARQGRMPPRRQPLDKWTGFHGRR